MNVVMLNFSNIVSVCALAVSIVAIGISLCESKKNREFFAEQNKDNLRENKINQVVEKYVEVANNNIVSGIPGLIKAGINNLADDGSIREAIKKIAPRVKKNPLGRDYEKFDGINLFDFFEFLKVKNIDPCKKPYDQLIKEYRQYLTL